LTERARAQLGGRYPLIEDRDGRLPDDLGEVRAIAAQGGRVPAELVQRCPKLAIVCTFGVGYDKVDTAALQARGITLAHAAGVTDGCVADMAFALLLAVMRRIVVGDRFVRAGDWTATANIGLAPRVWGGRMGIFGMGRIGAVIARRALGFDMTVGYHNRRPRADLPHRYFPDLGALADWADVLVVAAPGGIETANAIGRDTLRRLGPKGVIVNIARGTVIDEAALIAALAAGEIAGAGLDVFAEEPRVPDALKASDKVVLMPHRAGGTVETWEECGVHLIANLDAFFDDGRALTPVDLGGGIPPA
jgi:lactate dehydrogenase-like 2-hydroxyacid dehydrogenase